MLSTSRIHSRSLKRSQISSVLKDALVEADSLCETLVFKDSLKELETLADFTVLKDALVEAD